MLLVTVPQLVVTLATLVRLIIKGKVDRVTTLAAAAATLYPGCAGKRQVNGKAALDRVCADSARPVAAGVTRTK
jgi:hypothetical protein